MIFPGGFIALSAFSHLEQFYLCQVIALSAFSHLEQFYVCQVIALSALSHLEQFYVCQVICSETAEQDMQHNNGHVVRKGEKFFRCQYLKEMKEKAGNHYYRLLTPEIFVPPQQILSPFVNIIEADNELYISRAEFQTICDWDDLSVQSMAMRTSVRYGGF